LKNQIQILAPKNAVGRFLRRRIEGKRMKHVRWKVVEGENDKKVESSQLPRRWKEEGPSAS